MSVEPKKWGDSMISTIVVAVDGSGHAKRAVALAGELADKHSAELVLVTVSHGPLPEPLQAFASAEDLDHREVLKRVLRDAEEAARKEGARDVTSTLEDGDPATAILGVAERHGADMIVVGSRGLGELKGLVLGSVSHKVTHLAKCTCVTVR